MTGTQAAYLVLIVLVGVERLFELSIARRNLAWATKRGGVERGQGLFPFMVALHTGLLVGAPLEVILLDRALVPGLAIPALCLALACQGLRYWCIRSLGPLWNVRVVVVPGAAPVTSGPYRWLRHPNYLAVIVEGVALPLIHTAWISALAFTVLNALILRSRIRTEEAALRELTTYEQSFSRAGGLIPVFRSGAEPGRGSEGAT